MTEKEYLNLKEGDLVLADLPIEEKDGWEDAFTNGKIYEVSYVGFSNRIIIKRNDNDRPNHGWKYESWRVYECTDMYKKLGMEVNNDS